jgi:hypothetical protein
MLGGQASRLCPADEFRSALALVSAHLHNVSGEQRVLDYYTAKWAGWCPWHESASLRLWPPSERPKLINAGEGTTGTRFLACVADGLGFKSGHNPDALHVCLPTNASDVSSSSAQAELADGHCTHSWDAFTFLTDNPVPDQLVPLLLTNPAAPVMLSLRNPYAWRASRLAHHEEGQDVAGWGVSIAGCGVYAPRLLDAADDVAVAKLTYDAFAACIARGRGHKLLILDLFTEKPAAVQARIHGFLLGRFAWTQALTLAHVQDAWRQCKDPATWAPI